MYDFHLQVEEYKPSKKHAASRALCLPPPSSWFNFSTMKMEVIRSSETFGVPLLCADVRSNRLGEFYNS
jgi:hypothetical protein